MDPRTVAMATFGYKATTADIQCFKDWLEQVPYLPQDYGDHVIRLFIEGSKGRMEEAKNKFDGYHRVRMEYPDIFTNLDTEDPELSLSMNKLCHMAIPYKVLSKCGSIMVFHFPQHAEPNLTRIRNFYKCIQFGAMKIFHQRSFFEGIEGSWNGKLCLVTDLTHVTVAHTLMNPPTLLKGAFAQLNNLPLGVESLHYINASPALDTFIGIIKSFTKKKISERIHIHRDCESLKEIISAESLPSDYGGKLPSIKELSEQDNKWYREVRDLTLKWEAKLADLEKMRPKNTEDMIVGTFKKLEVD